MPCVGKSGRPSCATFFCAIRPFFPRGRVVSLPALQLDPSRIVAKNRLTRSFTILWDRRREFPGARKTGAGLFSQFRLKSHGTAPPQHYGIARKHTQKSLNHFKKSGSTDPIEIKIIQARPSFFCFLWDGSEFTSKARIFGDILFLFQGRP